MPRRRSYEQLADQAADKYGIPRGLFRALIKQESGWNPKAGSPAGAVGLTQIHLPSHPGVSYAQATDPAFAVDWGARYLAAQKKAFGNWRLALAAYNAGPGRVKDGAWTRIPETANYVKNVLAMAGDFKTAAPSQVPAGAAVPADPLVPAPRMPDLAGAALQGLATVGTRDFNPVADLSNLAQSVAAAQAPPAVQAGVVPQTTPAPPAARTGGVVMPLTTAMPGGSEFAIADAEGAPSKKGGRFHAGKDWFAPAGSRVAAPVTGRVVEVKASRGNSGQVFGGVVKVQGPGGRVYVFRHVDPAGVKVGQRVKAGTPIASVSAWTGGSPHAHIEVWRTLKGGYRFENMLDPARVFGR